MKFQHPIPVAELANLVSATVLGNAQGQAHGLNEIHRVEAGDIAFVDHPKYYQKVLESPATVILIDQETECPEGKTLLVCTAPTQAFNAIARHYNPPKGFYENPQEAIIGEHSWVSAKAVIGQGVRIGAHCQINPGVVLYPGTVIKDRVTIHANTTIGANAFYYQRKDGRHNPMYSCGDVLIENDVEIGANCTIDKGVTATTRIGEGTKIDNMVHIGHDTILGAHCLMAGQSAVAGCVTIGNNVTIWGNVAIASSVVIGDGAEILAKSGVNKNLEGGKRYFGSPAIEARQQMQHMAKLKRLISES